MSYWLHLNLNKIKTDNDVQILSKIEARIQADFKDGFPPHLSENAKSLKYLPGSDQSQIFVYLLIQISES